MKSETVTKPENVKETIWKANQAWIRLTSAQADIHREQRDPRLYRQSASTKIISPFAKD